MCEIPDNESLSEILFDHYVVQYMYLFFLRKETLTQIKFNPKIVQNPLSPKSVLSFVLKLYVSDMV